MTRSLLAEPLNLSAVLAESRAHEARIVAEWHAAVGIAQSRTNAPAPLVDEFDRPFVPGATVVTYRHISRTLGRSISHILPGMKGVITEMGPMIAVILLEDNPAPYKLAVRDMRKVLHVVEGATKADGGFAV